MWKYCCWYKVCFQYTNLTNEISLWIIKHGFRSVHYCLIEHGRDWFILLADTLVMSIFSFSNSTGNQFCISLAKISDKLWAFYSDKMNEFDSLHGPDDLNMQSAHMVSWHQHQLNRIKYFNKNAHRNFKEMNIITRIFLHLNNFIWIILKSNWSIFSAIQLNDDAFLAGIFSSSLSLWRPLFFGFYIWFHSSYSLSTARCTGHVTQFHNALKFD